jgi:hypothetical protein
MNIYFIAFEKWLKTNLPTVYSYWIKLPSLKDIINLFLDVCVWFYQLLVDLYVYSVYLVGQVLSIIYYIITNFHKFPGLAWQCLQDDRQTMFDLVDWPAIGKYYYVWMFVFSVWLYFWLVHYATLRIGIKDYENVTYRGKGYEIFIIYVILGTILLMYSVHISAVIFYFIVEYRGVAVYDWYYSLAAQQIRPFLVQLRTILCLVFVVHVLYHYYIGEWTVLKDSVVEKKPEKVVASAEHHYDDEEMEYVQTLVKRIVWAAFEKKLKLDKVPAKIVEKYKKLHEEERDYVTVYNWVSEREFEEFIELLSVEVEVRLEELKMFGFGEDETDDEIDDENEW